jgi:hypothetical protein
MKIQINEIKRMQQLAGIINENLVNIGTYVLDNMNDEYKVISITPDKIILKPISFEGENSIFPDDFGNNVNIDEFWNYLNKK